MCLARSSIININRLINRRWIVCQRKKINNILSRLPVRSVMICRSVCKIWCSIIDNPKFVSMHLYSSTEIINIDNDTSSFILLPIMNEKVLYIVEDYSDNLEGETSSSSLSSSIKSSEIYVPISEEPPLSVVGCSLGLLCLSFFQVTTPGVDVVYSIYICNPALQIFHLLPPAISPYSSICNASGFGFDFSTKNFKVVFIYYGNDSGSQRGAEIQVFTRSNSWRQAYRHFPGDVCPIYGASLICVSGSLHWLTRLWIPGPFDGGILQSPIRIVSFDLGLEEFSLVPNPEFDNLPNDPFNEVDYHRFKIGVLGGCLCLSDGSSQNDHFEIWVMKEYNVGQSWTKQYVIPTYFINAISVRVMLPVYMRKNGDLVLLCDSQFLISYNLENRTATLLEDAGLPRFHNLYSSATQYEVVPYVGSLLSPTSVC